MIWESHPWKVDLGRRGAWLRKQQQNRKWPESSLVRVEQNIMVGCYCVRKLIEAKKLTDRVSNRSVPLVTYRPTGKRVTHFNWHRIDELYDLERSTREVKTLTFLCNQLIHSYVFICAHNAREGLTGIMFASDRQRHQCLYQVSIRVLANVFEAVARDGVWSSYFQWNEARKDYDISNR